MKTKIQILTMAILAATLSALADQPEKQAREGDAERGEELFKGEFPHAHGNGRSCATCHVPKDGFQLTPEHVEKRYQALQKRLLTDPCADDPLFRAVDANDGIADFTNLRQHALVRIFIELPKDAAGQKLVWPVDDPDADVVSVWRSTPTIMNTAFTAPYQLDARQPTLQAQALGALINHSEITTAPKTKFLDDVAAFEKEQFSSRSVKRLAQALAKGEAPPPTDPPLNELELQGKAFFEHSCIFCHGGPTQTVPVDFLPPGVGDIQISKPPPPFADGIPFAPSPLTPRLWAFRVAGQVEPTVLPSTDPGKALLTGSIDQFNLFDMPSLFGISKTAPYFHDNSAATLEDVIIHYQHHFEAVRRVIPDTLPFPLRPDPITDDQIAPLVAYLKKI